MSTLRERMQDFKPTYTFRKKPAKAIVKMPQDKVAIQELLKVARKLVARRLKIVKKEVDEKNTTVLRAIKKLRARSRGSLPDSIEMAGYHAQKNQKTYYVYLGNSYGAGVWRVGSESDALDPINNQSDRPVFEVAPDLGITKLTIDRSWGEK